MELKSIGYELFIAALSILSIFNLLLRFVVRDESLEYVIFIMNVIMTPIFLGDFLYRFFTAKSKSRYFGRGFGWADLRAKLAEIEALLQVQAQRVALPDSPATSRPAD